MTKPDSKEKEETGFGGARGGCISLGFIVYYLYHAHPKMYLSL